MTTDRIHPTRAAAPRRVVAALLGLAMLAAGVPAAAQSKPAPSKPAAPSTEAPAAADAGRRAGELYDEGYAAAEKKDWEKAYKAFGEAWRLKQHWQIAMALGAAELELGKVADAHGHLRYCMANIPPGEPDAKPARKLMDRAEEKVGKVSVQVSIAGARVLVDGTLVGRAPLAEPLVLDPGKHEVEARLDTSRARRTVDVASGESLVVTLQLGEPRRAEAVDPPSPPAAPAPEDRSSLRTGVLISTGVLAGLGLGVGGVTAGLSVVQEGDRNTCLDLPESSPALLQQKEDCWNQHEAARVNLARASFSGFLLGGASLLAAAGVYWLFDAKPRKESAVSIAPAVGKEGGGFVVTGRW